MTGVDLTVADFLDEPWRERHAAGTLPPVSPFSGEHPGVLVGVGRDLAWIDRGVAPLVHAMWRAGVRTDESCEDVLEDGRFAGVGFRSREDASRLLRLVAPADEGAPAGVWDRATGCNAAPEGGPMWEWQTGVSVSGGRVAWWTYLLMPIGDVAEVTRRLAARPLDGPAA